jgi:hypothetical protein
MNLRGKKGFAFDTHIGNRLAGSAAKGIEKRLEDLKVSIVRPRASATISARAKEFEQIGKEIATTTR